MVPFTWLKLLHVSCALATIAGFALRGYWMARGDPRLKHPLVKTLPHVVDSLLLASAIGMLLIWQVSPFELDWLIAKIIALLAYIGFGMVALRFARKRSNRITAYLCALGCAAYILAVAYTKSPAGPLALLAG